MSKWTIQTKAGNKKHNNGWVILGTVEAESSASAFEKAFGYEAFGYILRDMADDATARKCVSRI